MTRLARLTAAASIAILAFSQTTEGPIAFEISDVHPSPLTTNNLFRRGPVMRGGRYEMRASTMVDLISVAYTMDTERILGGPSWLEMTRFDVTAKAPPNSTLESLKPALQQLLADRFHLVVKQESRPLPSYALTVGKKLQLKKADGAGESGCKPQAGSGSGSNAGMGMLSMMGADGIVTTIAMGPGGTIQFNCRNITMANFVTALPGLIGNTVGRNKVADQTGLEAAGISISRGRLVS